MARVNSAVHAAGSALINSIAAARGAADRNRSVDSRRRADPDLALGLGRNRASDRAVRRCRDDSMVRARGSAVHRRWRRMRAMCIRREIDSDRRDSDRPTIVESRRWRASARQRFAETESLENTAWPNAVRSTRHVSNHKSRDQ